MSHQDPTAPNTATGDSHRPRILFITEAHFAHHDGAWVAIDGVNGDTQWGRYRLPGCRGVVLGRTKNAKAEGDPITTMQVAPVADYQGLASALTTLPKVAVQIFREVRRSELIVARVPGPLSILAATYAKVLGKPYAIELVGDIYDVLSQGAVPGANRLATVGRWITQRVCASATVGRYVTQRTLQESYPIGNKPTIAISNVQIDDALRREAPLELDATDKRLRLIAVGSQEVSYKGHDVAIKALQLVRRQLPEWDVELTLVGGGRLHEELRAQAESQGLADHVHFTGQVPADEVRGHLCNADLLIQPSLTEGLPRVMIEAMSQALPVCGSRAGGIPELVAEEFLVPPGDAETLAAALIAMMSPATYAQQSERSLRESKTYALSRLNELFDVWSGWLTELAWGEWPARQRRHYTSGSHL